MAERALQHGQRMSDTPRTDDAEVYYSEIVTGRDGGLYWVRADFARQLERELAASGTQSETASPAPIIALRQFCVAYENRGETTSLKEWSDRLKFAYGSAQEVLSGREPYSEPK